MNQVADAVLRRGGLAATFELYADGHTRRELAEAVATNRVVRVRQGWYANPAVHPTLREASRIGGRTTCISGLALHGFWTVPSTDLHVAVARDACRLRARTSAQLRLAELKRPGVRVHWGDHDDGTPFLLQPIACLKHAIACQPAEVVTAAADSVLHKRPWLAAEWRELVASGHLIDRPWLDRIDGICESGIESIWWFWMRRLDLPIARQAHIPGVGRVDFLIGTRLVVEVDGFAYHSNPAQFEADRRRNALLSRLGYRVLRFSYLQVMESWPDVERAVLAAVLRGDHN